jgi:hypothetical protein
MKVSDIVKNHKLYQATVRVDQPRYTGYIDAVVSAPNPQAARILIKGMYGIPDHYIGSIREVR